jgi:hypothetical protein
VEASCILHDADTIKFHFVDSHNLSFRLSSNVFACKKSSYLSTPYFVFVFCRIYIKRTVSATPLMGVPILNSILFYFRASSWNIDHTSPMHWESGFIRFKPESKTVAFLLAHNFGKFESWDMSMLDSNDRLIPRLCDAATKLRDRQPRSAGSEDQDPGNEVARSAV